MSKVVSSIASVLALTAILGFVLVLVMGISPGGGFLLVPFPRERNAAEIVLNVTILVLPAFAVTALIALTLRYSWTFISKAFILVGAFFAIIMVQSSTLATSIWSIILLWFLMCVIVFITFFSVMGFLPEEINNIVYTTYGAIIGTFLGINLPTYSLILLVVVYSIYDVLFSKWVAPTISKNLSEHGFKYILIPLKDVGMGLGDIIFYSIMTSHTQRYFGTFVFFSIVISILIGCIITMTLAVRYKIFPGLPLPIILSVVTMLVNLLMIS